MRINGIATQGRPLNDDFVYEYALSYGSNGFDYADYKTSSGTIKVRFKAYLERTLELGSRTL